MSGEDAFIEVYHWLRRGDIEVGEPIYFKKKLIELTVLPPMKAHNG